MGTVAILHAAQFDHGDDTLRLSDDTVMTVLTELDGRINSLAFSPDSSLIAIVDGGKRQE